MDPWSKVDYSRHIREASMEMEGLPEVIPLSDRVPGQRLLAAPILKHRRRRYREEIGKKTCILGISSTGVLYRRRGAAKGATRGPGAPWRGPALGRATRTPGSRVVALWPHPGDFGRFRRTDFLSDFSGIFGALLIVGKPAIQKLLKIGTALGCTELIG